MSSYAALTLPSAFSRWFFADFTAASHSPPKCGARGGINFHFISFCAHQLKIALRSVSSTFSIRKILCSACDAPLKAVALSECSSAIAPLRATTRRSAARNAGVERSLTSSMCTAFVEKHTKMATYALVGLRLRTGDFKKNGPQ
uniref:(northern house mosquito) hypothetical protein n=1 Tax=Culex pipiens TaxID=7175 RepID=A0A8D8F9H2_CULPI